MTSIDSNNRQWEKELKLKTANLGLWTLVWLITMAIATFGPILIWDKNTTVSAIFIFINLLVGIAMIMAHKRHLQSLDELQRKIQMDAIAIALGGTLISGLCYSMLDIANVITFDAEISHLVMLMSLIYGVSLLIGKKRYS
ncbi:MAG: hypothetical protein ACPGJI_02240 [Kangiellaceae bacterium]